MGDAFLSGSFNNDLLTTINADSEVVGTNDQKGAISSAFGCGCLVFWVCASMCQCGRGFNRVLSQHGWQTLGSPWGHDKQMAVKTLSCEMGTPSTDECCGMDFLSTCPHRKSILMHSLVQRATKRKGLLRYSWHTCPHPESDRFRVLQNGLLFGAACRNTSKRLDSFVPRQQTVIVPEDI